MPDRKRRNFGHGCTRVVVFIAVCTAASGLVGCLAQLQGMLKQVTEAPGTVRDDQPQGKNARNIKPEMSSDSAQGQIGRDQGSDGLSQKPAGETGLNTESSPGSKREGEDQRVKNAALETAKAFPSVVKIRVCRAVHGDTWWVTLYDDSGTAINLKQYTWNREQGKLDPYLVLKRIARSQLEADISTKTQGTTCEVLDPPRPTP